MKRHSLGLVTLGLVFGMLIGCTFISFAQEKPYPEQYPSISGYQKVTGKSITSFNEAPILADFVKQGKLPPVEERLPEEPAVVEPVEEIGEYGGIWRRCWTGLSDRAGVTKLLDEHIISWTCDGKNLQPNLADWWEQSDDGKKFTIHLREEIKWSDGQPFTTDDVMFWYEDIALNEDLTPVFPSMFVIDGKPMEVRKIDRYTFEVQFEQPYPMFPYSLASSPGSGIFIAPKHYLMQFHPKYTPKEELEKLAKKEGFDFWHQLFAQKADYILNPDFPVLYPWKTKNAPSGATASWTMERNPYYWKVDTAGNQLPYIDHIRFEEVQNPEVAVMRMVAGEVDMQMRHINLKDYPLLMENREKGNYEILKWPTFQASTTGIRLNFAVEDPILSSLFNNDKFRKALSLAINREEIKEIVYLGLAEIRQLSLAKAATYYDPEWEKAFVEYDPEEANRLLDEVGLSRRDEENFRLRSDGKPLSLTIEVTVSPGGAQLDELELIKIYWEKAGIRTYIKNLERSLFTVRVSAGLPEISIWEASIINPLFDPSWIAPVFGDHWPAEYVRWFSSDGKSGKKPVDENINRLVELWREASKTVDENERTKLVNEIIELHKENLWFVGTVGETPSLVCVRNNFKNVPKSVPSFDYLRTPKNASPEQFFFKK